MITSRRSSDLIPVTLQSVGSPGALLISTSTWTWHRNFDSHTAASPGRSGGISFGGLRGLNVLITDVGALRATSTSAASGDAETSTAASAIHAAAAAREGNFMPRWYAGAGAGVKR